MLYYKLDHIVIDQTSLLLEGIHQCLFADPVDHTGNSGRCLVDLIHCFFSKKPPENIQNTPYDFRCTVLFPICPDVEAYNTYRFSGE